MKAVYIAGCFRGPTIWNIEQNVRRAEAAGLRVAELGVLPVIPHTMTKNFHGLLTDAFWLKAMQELMRRTDAVYMFEPGDYFKSQGTHDEVEAARKVGMPVFDNFADLEDWVKDGSQAVWPSQA